MSRPRSSNALDAPLARPAARNEPTGGADFWRSLALMGIVQATTRSKNFSLLAGIQVEYERLTLEERAMVTRCDGTQK